MLLQSTFFFTYILWVEQVCSTVWRLNESEPDNAFIFFICNFRLVFVTEPHFSQNAVESCGMPQKSQPDGPGRDKKSFCLLSVFKKRSLGLRMKKISCRVKGIIPAKPCLITKLNSSGIWMSFQSWQLICPTLFLFNQIKRKVISYKAYSKELGKIYVISKPQINLVLR